MLLLLGVQVLELDRVNFLDDLSALLELSLDLLGVFDQVRKSIIALDAVVGDELLRVKGACVATLRAVALATADGALPVRL